MTKRRSCCWKKKGYLTVRAERSTLTEDELHHKARPKIFRIRSAPTLVHIIEQQRSLLVRDTAAFPEWTQMHGFEGVKSWLGVPLIAGGKTDRAGFDQTDRSRPI